MSIRIPFHLKHLRCAEVLKGALEAKKENAKSKGAGDIKRKFVLGIWMYFKQMVVGGAALIAAAAGGYFYAKR